MNNTEKILSELDKITPQIPSKVIKNTAYKYAHYILVASLSIQVLLSVLTLFHGFIYSFPKSIINNIIYPTYFLSLITLSISFCYILFRKIYSFYKDKYRWDNSTEQIIHQEKYAKQLEMISTRTELSYVKELLNILTKKYEERVKFFGTFISISAILGGISIIDKIFGSVPSFLDSFNSSFLTSHLFTYSIALFLGMCIGTWSLKELIQRLNYKISIIEVALLRKELTNKTP